MNILVLGVQVPFTRGGAEILLDRLISELRSRGHFAELVQIPFSALPKEKILDSMSIWRALDLRAFAGKEIDLVIGSKFPSYCAAFPRKKVWLIHQHRQAYELYGTPFGDFDTSESDESLRQMIEKADLTSFRESLEVFTISETVTARLKNSLGIDSVTLAPPPPLLGKYRRGKKGDYLLSVGRLCSIKRPDLLVRALSRIDPSLRVKIVGTADEPGYMEHLMFEIERSRLERRVDLLGRVSEEDLIDLYANAFAVFYAPHDEDYGFVTLEGLLSGKPVITAEDSGGVLNFITHESNGLVARADEEGIASAANRLLDESLYTKLVVGTETPVQFATWDEIVDRLTNEAVPAKAG